MDLNTLSDCHVGSGNYTFAASARVRVIIFNKIVHKFPLL